MPRSRLAPSPTGYLHLGNARSFLLAWLQGRSMDGEVILRIEDIDRSRAVDGADSDIVRDLEWLGLDWDNELTSNYYQSNREEIYREGLERLVEKGLIYPCYCSRKELREALSAPHGREGRYPGTCRELTEEERSIRLHHKEPALRLRVEPGTSIEFEDGVHGMQRSDLFEETGDFIVARADGLPSYQLAVVLDDIDMNVTHVLRGDDLLTSTPRQIFLYHLFGHPHPNYSHVPLIVGSDNERLAKRHGSVSLAELREEGVSPENIVGWLAWSCGLIDVCESVRGTELIQEFDLQKIRRTPTRIERGEEIFCR